MFNTVACAKFYNPDSTNLNNAKFSNYKHILKFFVVNFYSMYNLSVPIDVVNRHILMFIKIHVIMLSQI